MRYRGIAAGIFTFLDIVLIVVCVLLYMRLDRICPEVSFQASELVYTKQTMPGELLGQIAAYDDCDGDITDRIVIEKIVENRSESCAIVFYAVCDKSGNVTKVSRVFPAEFVAEDENVLPLTGAGQ